MTIESAKALAAKAVTDEDLAKQLGEAKTEAAFNAVVSKRGYTCTAEEFEAAFKEAKENTPLTDEMSMKSAVAFYERIEKDSEMQLKMKELGSAEDIERYVKGELGYDFTMEEMQKVIFERNPELTDEELDAVTGGSMDFAMGLLAGAGGVGAVTAGATVVLGAAFSAAAA